MAEMKIGVKNRDMEVNHDDENVKAMQDFTSPDVLYRELISSVLKYHPSTDISMIEKAYKIASEAHQGQLRKSGEPYIIHPLCVAIILADLELDKETIVAGLLHDAVEDTVMTTEEIAQEFGTKWLFWWTASRNWASCLTPRIRLRFRLRICVRCSWPWRRISGSF